MRQVNKNLIDKLLYCLVILAAALWSSQGFAATEISNVRYWAAPDHTRVVFDLSNQTDYQFNIRNNTLTLEFSDARLKNSLPSRMIVDKPGIDKIIFTTVADSQCKIEIVLSRYLKAEVFKLKRFMDKPNTEGFIDAIAETLKNKL